MAPLSETLKTLGLHHTATHLDDLVALATKRRWSPIQLLEHLVADGAAGTHPPQPRTPPGPRRIGRFTPMGDFDWAWPTRIDRAAVEAALRLDFLTAGRNLVLVAAQGLGKTMIAQNIAHQAVLAGHHVLFLTAAQLLLDLGSQDSARGLARRLQYYSQQGLLVVDSCGVVSNVELPCPGALGAGIRARHSTLLMLVTAPPATRGSWRCGATRGDARGPGG